MNNRAKGAVYEDKAAGELRRLGYNILTKNFYCRGGELDIVAENGKITYVDAAAGKTAKIFVLLRSSTGLTLRTAIPWKPSIIQR